MANHKFDGKVQITERTVRGKNSLAAKVAKDDMKKEGIELLSEQTVLTEEGYQKLMEEVYLRDRDEPYWNL